MGKRSKKTNYSEELPKEEDFNFDLIEHYFKRKDYSTAFQIVDYQLINDVDLNEVFMYIDRTNSKIVQQYLYSQLHSINTTFAKPLLVMQWY